MPGQDEVDEDWADIRPSLKTRSHRSGPRLPGQTVFKLPGEKCGSNQRSGQSAFCIVKRIKPLFSITSIPTRSFLLGITLISAHLFPRNTPLLVTSHYRTIRHHTIHNIGKIVHLHIFYNAISVFISAGNSEISILPE